MLEDDCEVSTFFFRYLLMVLEIYDIPNGLPKNSKQLFASKLGKLVGISLYTPLLNEIVDPPQCWNSTSMFKETYRPSSSSVPFIPAFKALSAHPSTPSCPALYLFQLPCSWGALYFPWWWIRLQRYYNYRQSSRNLHLDSLYNVPNSRSNQWLTSWKK